MMVLTLCCVCASAKRAESPGPSEESAAPVTRSRRRVVKDTSVAPHVSASAYDVHTFLVWRRLDLCFNLNLISL